MGYIQTLKGIFSKKKPVWASLCSMVYADKKGNRYYKHNDQLDMSVIRKGEIDKCLLELRFGANYHDVFSALKDSLNEHDKRGNMKPDLSKVGYLVNELADREEMLIVPDILFKICANTLIREDESPFVVDHEILGEKVDVFKKEIQRGGLHGFFHSLDLLKLIGLSTTSPVELMQYMIDSETKLHNQKRMIQALTLDRQSERGSWIKENITLMN